MDNQNQEVEDIRSWQTELGMAQMDRKDYCSPCGFVSGHMTLELSALKVMFQRQSTNPAQWPARFEHVAPHLVASLPPTLKSRCEGLRFVPANANRCQSAVAAKGDLERITYGSEIAVSCDYKPIPSLYKVRL